MVKHDWYQTDSHVTITLLIKNADSSGSSAVYDQTTRIIRFIVKLQNGDNESLEFKLSNPVVAEHDKSIPLKVTPSKLEVKLQKTEPIRWSCLEGENLSNQPPVVMQSLTNAGETIKAYPTSYKKKVTNWDKVEKEVIEEDKNEKLDGDAALNKLFQQIYADGSDETRKAMNKSFSESGGTVLSTNFKEVGEKKVEMKPPDGMEFKKYDL